MKVKLTAIVTFHWEEDSKNWKDDFDNSGEPKTPEEILARVREAVKDDEAYILDGIPESIEVSLA